MRMDMSMGGVTEVCICTCYMYIPDVHVCASRVCIQIMQVCA